MHRNVLVIHFSTTPTKFEKKIVYILKKSSESSFFELKGTKKNFMGPAFASFLVIYYNFHLYYEAISEIHPETHHLSVQVKIKILLLGW